jgi:hypothetical protein
MSPRVRPTLEVGDQGNETLDFLLNANALAGGGFIEMQSTKHGDKESGRRQGQRISLLLNQYGRGRLQPVADQGPRGPAVELGSRVDGAFTTHWIDVDRRPVAPGWQTGKTDFITLLINIRTPKKYVT